MKGVNNMYYFKEWEGAYNDPCTMESCKGCPFVDEGEYCEKKPKIMNK